MILEMVEQGEMTAEQGRREYKELEEEDNGEPDRPKAPDTWVATVTGPTLIENQTKPAQDKHETEDNESIKTNKENISHCYNEEGTIRSTIPTTGIGTTQDTPVLPDNPLLKKENDNNETIQDHPHEQDRLSSFTTGIPPHGLLPIDTISKASHSPPVTGDNNGNLTHSGGQNNGPGIAIHPTVDDDHSHNHVGLNAGPDDQHGKGLALRAQQPC